MSHSHHDRVLVGQLKDTFWHSFAVRAFVAHNDINPSEDWQATILTALRECTIFMPVMTTEFSHSSWTDQETGIAVALDKLVIPVKKGLDPYGFITRYQAYKWDEELDVTDNASELVGIIYNKLRRIGQLTDDGVIEIFGRSCSFYDAQVKLELLLSISRLSERQIAEVAFGVIHNSQISGCYRAQKKLPRLFEDNLEKLSPQVVQDLKKIGFVAK